MTKELEISYLRGLTLLYVEDEELIREGTAKFLKRRIDNVYLASNGMEGLSMYRKIHPDIIITDIRMPEMDGLEMARTIKEQNDDIPIIITTGHNDEEFFLKSIDIGIDKYIKKPLEKAYLLNVLVKYAKSILQQKKIEANNQFINIILDNSPEFILITNGADILYLNKSFLRFLDCRYMEEFFDKYGTIDPFIVPVEDSFYKGMIFKEWVSVILNNIDNEYIISMKGTEYTADKPKSYLIHMNEIPDVMNSPRYLMTFTDITQIECERQHYHDLSIKDPLTKIFNRKKFFDELDKEIERADRYERKLSLIMFDIDHFKDVNDNHGHQAGDYVLQELTGIVENNIRKTDVFARYGGEEFIIMSPEINLESAFEIAEKLRDAIEKKNFENIGAITCSFGVAEHEAGEDSDVLVRKVDNALYESKSSGRNRVSRAMSLNLRSEAP